MFFLNTTLSKKNSLRFDIKLNNFWNGEDQLFFLQLSRLGKKIIWSKKINVTETIHAHRFNLNWLITRSYRLGVLEIILIEKFMVILLDLLLII